METQFIKLDDVSNQLPFEAPDWSQVLDPNTQLIWSRRPIGNYRWADLGKAANNCRIGDRTDWSAPSIQQQLSIVDYNRFGPAFNELFTLPKSGWLWTSTPVASARSDYAWLVALYNGESGLSYQDGEGLLLVCRSASASQ